jgi:hypothetical protein
VVGFRGQALGDFTKQHWGEIQLAGEMIRDGDRGGHRLGEEAAVDPESAELHRKATALGLAPTLEDLRFVPGRQRPVLRELLLTRVFGQHERRRAPAEGHTGLLEDRWISSHHGKTPLN